MSSCWKFANAAAVLLGVVVCTGTNAQEDVDSDVQRTFSAVVGVVTQVAEDARTAQILGTRRLGSGVVIDSSGLIVTIGYVLLEAAEALVFVERDQPVPAEVVGYDVNSGIGLLRALEPLEVEPLSLGRSSEVEPKDRVLVVSFSSPRQVTPAFVVSRDEFAGYWEYLLDEPIVISPPHRTIAGAAMFSESGEFMGVGMLTMGAVPVYNVVLPGSMFVPVDELKRVLGGLLTDGRAPPPARPWMGVYVTDGDGGIIVTDIAADGPAEEAGLESGDLIVGIDGLAVSSLPELYRSLWSAGDAGVEVSLSVRRESEVLRGQCGYPRPIRLVPHTLAPFSRGAGELPVRSAPWCPGQRTSSRVRNLAPRRAHPVRGTARGHRRCPTVGPRSVPVRPPAASTESRYGS